MTAIVSRMGAIVSLTGVIVSLAAGCDELSRSAVTFGCREGCWPSLYGVRCDIGQRVEVSGDRTCCRCPATSPAPSAIPAPCPGGDCKEGGR